MKFYQSHKRKPSYMRSGGLGNFSNWNLAEVLVNAEAGPEATVSLPTQLFSQHDLSLPFIS